MPPVVYEQTPTLAQIAERVNHSRAIEQLESNTLTISSPDMMGNLSGSLIWERPENFNLQGYSFSKMVGTVFAAGSNSDMFWLQQQIPSPPTIYYAKYDAFNSQLGPRQIIPVSPLWLREALGVIDFDPDSRHDEPIVRADGKIEIVSHIPTPRGTYQRVLVIDPKTAVVEQTQLRDATSKMVAIAQQSEHQYYAAIDWNLPHKVSVQLSPDQGPPLAFNIEIGFYLINQGVAGESANFQPPDPTGITTVNLVELNGLQAATVNPPTYRQATLPNANGQLMNFRR